MNGREIEELMQTRLDNTADGVERDKISLELERAKQRHLQKVDISALDKLQASWIERTLGIAASVI